MRRLCGCFGWLLALLAAPVAQAQAPAWALATSGSLASMPAGSASSINGTATDPATGNVYVTGFFTGTVGFGATQLVSAGGFDVFVAKWDATANAWTSAVRGGGTGDDGGLSVAVVTTGGVASVYLTGYFTSGGNASLAGTALAGTGGLDMFVAKYTDSGAGLSAMGGGALGGGGTSDDRGQGIAVLRTGSTTAVYVTGSFTSGPAASIAGTALAGAGGLDVFVAKYTDAGTGLSTAGGGAVRGGSAGADEGKAIAAVSVGSLAYVYVTGSFTGSTSLAGTTLTAAGNSDVFVARYSDAGAGLSATGGAAVSGGGGGYDTGYGLAAVSTGTSTSVYVAGSYDSASGATIAGTPLAGAGSNDLFVAKYTDTGTSLSATGGGAVRGGGPGYDIGYAVAVARTGNATTVYVAGIFSSGGSASIAGTTLTSTGSVNIFVAKYTDVGFGLSATGGGAVGGGGTSFDQGNSIALAGQRVYLGGFIIPPATFGSVTLAGPTGGSFLNVLARINDATLTPLPTRAAGAAAELALFPNPATTLSTLSGAAPGAAVRVLDVLGRLVLTTTADASGAAALGGLAPGVYVVRAGAGAVRLAVQ